jgi:hypothetical protein
LLKRTINARKEKPGLCIVLQRPGFLGLLCIPLGFADSEHLGAANRAGALRGRFTILHFNGFGIAHFSLFATLHAICLHLRFTSFFLDNS